MSIVYFQNRFFQAVLMQQISKTGGNSDLKKIYTMIIVFLIFVQAKKIYDEKEYCRRKYTNGE